MDTYEIRNRQKELEAKLYEQLLKTKELEMEYFKWLESKGEEKACEKGMMNIIGDLYEIESKLKWKLR